MTEFCFGLKQFDIDNCERISKFSLPITTFPNIGRTNVQDDTFVYCMYDAYFNSMDACVSKSKIESKVFSTEIVAQVIDFLEPFVSDLLLQNAKMEGQTHVTL